MSKPPKGMRIPKDDFVSISIGVEYLFSHLFGKQSTHGLSGFTRQGEWKKLRRRLVETLDRYIDANLETDKIHFQRIKDQIHSMQIALRREARIEREPNFTAALFRLCFLLLGDMPNHWNKRLVNRPEYYRLNHTRSLQYQQSASQKRTLILRECRNKSTWKLTDDQYEAIQKKSFDLSAREFLEWFKENHSTIYLKMF